MPQRERLKRELEQLTKTYRAGIIDEREFNRGRERIEGKMAQLEAEEKKQKEGKKIITEILGSEAVMEEPKPEKKPEPKETVPKTEAPKPKAPKPAKPRTEKKVKKSPGKPARKKAALEDDDSTFSKIIIFAGIVCILLLLVLVKVFTDSREPDNRTLAEPGTEVSVEMYLDFTCEYAKESWDAMIALKKEFGDSLKIRVRHFPLSAEAVDAASAVECARAQGMHMEYIEAVISETVVPSRDVLKNLAWAKGLDVIEFHSCLDSDAHLQTVKADLKEGYEAGVRASPTFFINGEMTVGSQSQEYFRKKIELGKE